MPSFRAMRPTVMSEGAEMVVSIFIASIMNRGAFFLTVSPGFTKIFESLPEYETSFALIGANYGSTDIDWFQTIDLSDLAIPTSNGATQSTK